MIPVFKSTDPDPVPVQEFLNDECKLLDRYELQRQLVETLERTEHHSHLAPRVAACHHTFHHKRCDQNHDWATAEDSCSVRICPHDSRRRSLILAGRLERFLVGQTGLRYAVFAEGNTKDLREGTASLWEAWTSLRRSVRWKKHVRGCIVAFEATYNPHCICGLRKTDHCPDGRAASCTFQEAPLQESPWHPHLNVLMQGDFFPFEELNQAWIAATAGRGRTSFIRAADAGTVRELIKYITKIADLIGNAFALDEFLTAVARRRLLRTYGIFHGLPVDDEENPGEACPDCGSTTFVDLGPCPSWQISLDLEGVLRPHRPPHEIAARLPNAVKAWLRPLRKPRSKVLNALDRCLQPSKQALAAHTHKLWDDYLAHGREL